MIGDLPLEYSPQTLGLPQDVYDKGRRMLLASSNGKNQLKSMHARWRPHILEDLRTAAHGYSPLPGIGTEFWRTAKLHILMACLPPSVSPALLEPAKCVDQMLLKDLIVQLKAQWTVHSRCLYQLQWDKLKFFTDVEGRLFLHIPLVFADPHKYQNGDVIAGTELSYHGTRSFNVASILQKGLLSSTKAHKVIGLWLNDDIEEALNWNVSLMDSSGGLAFSVHYNPECNRQNSDIMQGNPCRIISELRNNTIPSVQAQAIFMSAPSPQRLTWITQFYRIFEIMFHNVLKLPLPHHALTSRQLTQLLHITWHFTAMRLAYRATAGAMDDEFGGPYSFIPTFALHVSKPVVLLLWALQLQSFRNRCDSLQNIRMRNIPSPLRQFFLCKFPSLRVWCNWELIDDSSMSQWALGPLTQVQPWSHNP
jgi:hypothetical protein